MVIVTIKKPSTELMNELNCCLYDCTHFTSDDDIVVTDIDEVIIKEAGYILCRDTWFSTVRVRVPYKECSSITKRLTADNGRGGEI